MKALITEYKDLDWIDAFDGQDAAFVQEWVAENVPPGYFLDIDSYYESYIGRIKYVREETDEEYSDRLVKEKAEKEKRDAETIRQAYLLQNKIALLKGQDLALSSYLEKHKDNPRIGDMENLFMVLQQAILNNQSGPAVEQVKECLARLENS